MRVMVIVKATKNSEAGLMPSEQLLTEMGQYNEDLVKAFVLPAANGAPQSAPPAGVRDPADRVRMIGEPAVRRR